MIARLFDASDVARPPNPRLQRTPSAPLSRKPLGGRRLEYGRRRRILVVLVSLTAAACTSALGARPGPTALKTAPPRLMLQMALMHPIVRTSDRVSVEWQVENVGREPVYICQWPGIAFSQKWDCPGGVDAGIGPGYPQSQHLTRNDFLQLRPGETLVGHGQVDVRPTPTGKVSLSAEFRSGQDGREYGLSGWKGTIRSEWVSVSVPRDETSKTCAEQ
jgi:hypothetical protein